MGQSDHLERALNCKRSVFIQACAGAGKTFALTKRYAAILDSFAREAVAGAPQDEIDQKRILVITFTKKAAGEMIDRISKDVSLLLSGEEILEMKGQGIDFCSTLRSATDKGVRSYAKNLRDTFSRNSISTIDSFCGALIKEFAHKLELDPQFALLEDAESQRLLNENMGKWLKEKTNKNPHVFDLLLEDMSFEQIRRAIGTLYGSREVLDEFARRIEDRSAEMIWRDWLERYTPHADIERLSVSFEELWEDAKNNCKDHDDGLYKILEFIHNENSVADRDHPLEFRAAFINIIRKSGLLTAKNEYRKKLPGNKQNWKNNKETANEWYEQLKTIDMYDLLHSPGPQDKKIIPLLKELIAFYREFNDFYSKAKMLRNVLDFSDVIIKTHEMLILHADIRKQIGKRYRHIMLDEFQDTNPMRWDIIRMIFESGDDIKLFIVGDRKQSIYRFNHADVTVMNKAQELVEKLNGEILDFNDNYRSSETFIQEGINPLMEKILPEKEEITEAYEADFQSTKHKIDKENISPALEMHWCNTPGEKDDQNYSALHAAWQVKRLLEVYQGSPIDKEGKPLIGVLFRKFTDIADYLQVFRGLDIPISIVGGKGFYTSPAVLDIYHFLSVLDNLYDDHALAGLLRSPFIGLADPDLHLLSKRDPIKTPLFEAMEDHPGLHGTKERIRSWINAAGRMPLDKLIAGILDGEDRELGYVSEMLPQQQLANLDKAINIIRGMQKNGSSLREIRENFYFQASHETSEAQAVYPGTAKVHLLTVHKAKGLEYPIVVIPEMNSKGNASKDNVRFGRSGDHAEISLSLSDQDKPGLLLKLKDIGDREEEAEDKRVFYVAMTRAVYKVCFLAEGKTCKSNTWWHKYILRPDKLENEEGKPLAPETWPEEAILQVSHKELRKEAPVIEHEVGEWTGFPQGECPGYYLFRTPHDLMGDQKPDWSSEVKAGSSLALGSLYHMCIEQNLLDIKSDSEEISELIRTQFPDADKTDLFERVEKLLDTTASSALSGILQNGGIEKYHELPLKAWLRKGKDTVQVNGTVDLLYRENGEWVIVDFKTDATRDRLPSYRKQLMTYQWMLKQAFGFEASGKIFFVSLNEIVDVAWNSSYFDELPVGKGFRPGLPVCSLDVKPLLTKIKEGKHLLICASSHHVEQVILALIGSSRMRPDISVTTLNKWIGTSPLKGIPSDRLRLMIQRSNPELKSGTVDYLAKAFRDHELKKGEIRPEFIPEYLKLKNNPEYRPADLPYEHADASGFRIGFVDPAPSAPLERELISRLRSDNEHFDCSLVPEKTREEYGLIEAFSPREEVLAVAKHIRDTTAAGDDILITVSSMEKYAPHLKRLFPQLGLQVRFSDIKSADEYPVTTLILNVLKLSAISHPEWQDVAPILLHPLMRPDNELIRHDRKIRSNPGEEMRMPSKAEELIDYFRCNDPDEVIVKIEQFISEHQLENHCGEDGICEKILQTLDGVISDLRELYPGYNISTVSQEVKTRLKRAGIPRKDQFNGIPVVGFLDSLGSVPNRLYVMGMVEGDIPRPEDENPCMIGKEKLTLELNRHFMEYWKALGERIVFSCARHSEDGSEQNRSSFLRDLVLREILPEDAGKRAFLLNYDSMIIQGDERSLIRRHNEIVLKGKNIFSGRVNEISKTFHLPVTCIDALLACPMRFYFDRVLRLKKTDEDENKFWIMKKGSVIHRALEYFAGENGFSKEADAAVELFRTCIFKVFDEENIDIRDPFQADQFRDYIRDLEPGSETNGPVKLLKDIREMFADYDRVVSEKEFSDFLLKYDDVSVYLSGRIDKLMFDDGEKRLIAADYKTGTVKLKDLGSLLLSQLYLYMKKCREDYPDHECKAVYEQIRDAKNTRIYILSEQEGDFVQENSRNANAFNIEEFENYLKDLFLQIAEGNYYITDRAFRDACKNCPHEGLCRKGTRMRSMIV